MRILYVCADAGISARGTKGASAHLRGLGAALAGEGHEVLLATRRRDGPNPVERRIRSIVLPPSPDAQTAALERLCANSRVDVVLERYSLESGPGLEVARSHGVPHVLELNAPLAQEAARWRGLVDVAAALERERQCLRGTSAVIAMSRAVAHHAAALGAPDVHVIPNGADVGRFGASRYGQNVRHRLRIPSDAFVVGFCGAMRPWHGVVDLVEAVARTAPSVWLLLVGDGPESSRAAQRAAGLGFGDRIRRTGARPDREVPHLLAAMDLAAAPYAALDDFYFSPLKVVEYLAAGLPTVASAQGQLLDLAAAVELVSPGDVNALAAALERLRRDPARRRELIDRGRAAANERSWQRTAQQVVGVLASALKQRGSAARQ
jgi:glycosyltransferase involved in cell wall biosynthesis